MQTSPIILSAKVCQHTQRSMASLRPLIQMLSKQLSLLFPQLPLREPQVNIEDCPALEKGTRSLYSVSNKPILSPHEVGLFTILKAQSAIFTNKPTPLEVLLPKKDGNINFPYISGRTNLEKLRKVRKCKKKLFDNGISKNYPRDMNQSKKLRLLWEAGHLHIDISGDGHQTCSFETYLNSTHWMRFHWPRVGTLVDHQLTVTTTAQQLHDDLMAVIRPRARRQAENMIPYIKDLDKKLPKTFSFPSKLKRATAPTVIILPPGAEYVHYDQVHLLSFEEQPDEEPKDYPTLNECEGSDFFTTEYLLTLINQRWINSSRMRVVKKGTPQHQALEKKATETFNHIWPVMVERLIKRGHAATEEYVDVQQWFTEHVANVDQNKIRVVERYTADFLNLVQHRHAVLAVEDRKIYDVEQALDADSSTVSDDDNNSSQSESSLTTTVSIAPSQDKIVTDVDLGYDLNRGNKLENFPPFDGNGFKADDTELKNSCNDTASQSLIADGSAVDGITSDLVASQVAEGVKPEVFTCHRCRNKMGRIKPSPATTNSRQVCRPPTFTPFGINDPTQNVARAC